MSHKKLHVTLIRGPIVASKSAVNNEATPAIGFAYISSYLNSKGYKTNIVDAIGEGLNRVWPLKNYPGFNAQGLSFIEIVDSIPGKTDVIGFSGMFSGEWPILRNLILEVRKHFPEALFVAGGEHITALTEYSLRDCPALDVCVRGEGEHTFYSLLESYKETGGFTDVEGVGYLDHDGCYKQIGIRTPRINNIDEIPWPYWPDGYLEKFWATGKSYGVSAGRDMPFMFSRGCPYNCTFCSSKYMYTSRYVLRDIEDVIAEIKSYITRYNIDSVQLYDLTAIIKKRWIVAFCNRLIEEGIMLKWSLPSGTRSEALDKESLSLLKKTGCSYLVYAPESGSPRTLMNINKRISLDKLTKSAIEAKKQGLAVRINLIIGFPDETWKDVFQTIWYGLKMSTRGMDEVPLFIFSPYPGTNMFQKLLEVKRISINDSYFLSLTSLNSAYLSTTAVVSCTPHINSIMLGLIRTVFILTNYAISYILYPHRIYRTLRSLLTGNASTVFEHRLQDIFKKKHE